MGRDLSIPPHWYQRPRLVLLDAGMATRLAGEDRRNMVGLFESFSALDGACMADWVLRFSGARRRAGRASINSMKGIHVYVIFFSCAGRGPHAGRLGAALLWCRVCGWLFLAHWLFIRALASLCSHGVHGPPAGVISHYCSHLGCHILLGAPSLHKVREPGSRGGRCKALP